MDFSVSITSHYAFFPIKEVELAALREELLAFGMQREMRGLVLIANEGINATVCGTESAVNEWKNRIKALEPTTVFKDSTADKLIFRRWSVKVKPEIVAIKQDRFRPQGSHRHLTPEEWNAIRAREDVLVIDARNHFEVELGKFRGAVDPNIKHFSDFPAYVRASGLPKDKKVLMYCTGGIRCEKAILAMESEGYSNVYQLEGGILNYLEQCPHQDFEGECFVFDKRVALDQELQPSQTFKLCSECGEPTTDVTCPLCAQKIPVSA